MSQIKKAINQLSEKKMPIVIDAETTGLNPDTDELLQLSIIDIQGNVIYNSYFRPSRHRKWPDAMKVNHITPDMVRDAPSLSSQLPAIQEIINKADLIIGYNVSFDLNFLMASGLSIDHLYSENDCRYWVEDLMDLFAAIYGDWNSYFESYTWKSLGVAANYYDYNWGKNSAHDSLADCLATLHIWKRMNETGDLERAYRLHAET